MNSEVLTLRISIIFAQILIRMIKTSPYLKLHAAVLLAGFTGIFGKMVCADEFVLVWYRMLIVSVILGGWLFFSGQIQRLSGKDLKRVGLIGALVAVHWVTFYGSILKSNISVGVVCFSLCGLFSAICEPFILKKKFSVREFLLGVAAAAGVLLIFSFDTRYRLGITFGTISALLASLFTIYNRKYNAIAPASNMLLYEMVSGFAVLTLLIPGYLYFLPAAGFLLQGEEVLLMVILAVACTIVPWIFQIQSLKHISAFTVNLTFNLEPVYSIILAFVFFHEAHQLNFSFYAGLAVIICAVAIQAKFRGAS